MVTILVKEQVVFLVIAENREIPVTIIVTFFGDNIATKYKFYVKLNRNDIGMFKNPKIAIQK